MLVISIYVRRSLQPLRQMSQLAGTISADDLEGSTLQLERAPSEVKELAQTFNMTVPVHPLGNSDNLLAMSL